MRWGLGSLTTARRRQRGDETARPPEPPQPRAADWRRVPPLGLTITPRPTLVGGTLLGPPEVAGTGSLIRPRLNGTTPSGAMTNGPAREITAEVGPFQAGPFGDPAPAPPSGRVTGVVVAASPRVAATDEASRSARPRALTDRLPADRLPADRLPADRLPAELPPVRRRTAVRGSAAGPRRSLTEATGEFVGEPRPDETPYASSAWLRMVQAYRQLPAAASDEVGASIPGFAESAKPGGGSVTSWSSSAAFPPPYPKAGPAATTPRVAGGAPGADASPAAPQQRPRRASLAESRRLGIGRPLQREQRPPAEEQPAPPAADRTAAAEPGQARPDGSDIGYSPDPSHVSEGTESPSITPPPAPSSAPAPPSAGTAQVTRRMPPHLGLGPPITLRGVSPAGDRLDQGPTERTNPDAARPRPGSPPAAQRHTSLARLPQPLPASAAPHHPLPGHTGTVDAASTVGQGQAPESADPVGAWPGHEPPPAEAASQAADQQRHPRPPQDEERQAANAPSAIVAPVYRGASSGERTPVTPRRVGSGGRPPVTPRGASEGGRPPGGAQAQTRGRALRPPGHAAEAEPLVHRQAEQPREPQPADEPSPAPQVTDPPAGKVAPPPASSSVEADLAAPGPPWPWLSTSQVSQPLPGGFAGPDGFSGLGAGQASREPESAQPIGAEPPVPPPMRDEAAASLVPYDLADTLRRMHGVDVSDVLISRAPEAGQRARALGARAFTADGEIVLPPEAGPIERPRTQALLAHELTHAAQQRALGSTLPPEDSVAGAALESAAVAVERRVLGQEHHVRAGSIAQVGGIRPDQQQPLFHAPRPAPAWSAAESGGMIQRQTEEIGGGTPAGDTFDPFGLLPQQSAAPVPDLMLDAGPLTDQTVAPDVELALARNRLLELAEQRLLDLNDPIAVGELAEGVYKRIRARLQRELLIDRERSGLLSDFR